MAHVGGGFVYLATHAVLGEMLKHGKNLVLTSFSAGVALIAVLIIGLRLLGGRCASHSEAAKVIRAFFFLSWRGSLLWGSRSCPGRAGTWHAHICLQRGNNSRSLRAPGCCASAVG